MGVNADRRESNLDLIPEETLALWRGNPGAEAEQAPAATQSQQKQQLYSLWWYLMLLVLGAAIAESLVASRYLATQREEP